MKTAPRPRAGPLRVLRSRVVRFTRGAVACPKRKRNRIEGVAIK